MEFFFFFWCDVVCSRVCFYLDAYHLRPTTSIEAHITRRTGLDNVGWSKPTSVLNQQVESSARSEVAVDGWEESSRSQVLIAWLIDRDWINER